MKAIVEHELDLADQLKSWYDMESYGAIKNVDSRSADDRRANKILERTTFHKSGRYHVWMLWSEDDPELPNNYFSALAQFKLLENRLGKDPELSTSYAKTISEDLA